MRGLTLTSWLTKLNRIYRGSHYVCTSRRVYHPDSPGCMLDFEAMDRESLILHFEEMVDDRDKASGNDLRRKCDLIVIQGSDSCVEVVLIELKANVRGGRWATRSSLTDAKDQLRNSVSIVLEEIANCRIHLPDQRFGHAVVVMSGVHQASVARDMLSKETVSFRRETGFRLMIARCGDDIGQLIGSEAA